MIANKIVILQRRLIFNTHSLMNKFLKLTTLLLTLLLAGCQTGNDPENDDNNKPQGSVKNNHIIHYTSTDGQIVTPYSLEAIDAQLLSNTYEDGRGSMVFDKEITTIGKNAFLGCRTLKSVTIPESVNTLGLSCFPYCTNLAEFRGKFATEDGLCLIINNTLCAFAPASKVSEYTIPESVSVIGMAAFAECKNLRQITIPEGTSAIGIQAFAYCSGLTKVTIPSTVSLLGESAFYGCTSLTSVYCRPTTPPIVVKINVEDKFLAFDQNGSARTIYVPAGSVQQYIEADDWKDYAESIKGYAF